MLPVAAQVPVAGSYSSAELSDDASSRSNATPPATRTSPLGSSVAVCSVRGVIMLPVTVHADTRGGRLGAVDGDSDCPTAGAANASSTPIDTRRTGRDRLVATARPPSGGVPLVK